MSTCGIEKKIKIKHVTSSNNLILYKVVLKMLTRMLKFI